jgi:hypothetical protein
MGGNKIDYKKEKPRFFRGSVVTKCSVCNETITTKTKGNIGDHKREHIKCGPCYLKSKKEERRLKGLL